MIWWQRLWRRKKMEDDLDKELRFHLEEHTADLIAQGFDPQEARRRASLALGGAEQVKERCRDARGTRPTPGRHAASARVRQTCRVPPRARGSTARG